MTTPTTERIAEAFSDANAAAEALGLDQSARDLMALMLLGSDESPYAVERLTGAVKQVCSCGVVLDSEEGTAVFNRAAVLRLAADKRAGRGIWLDVDSLAAACQLSEGAKELLTILVKVIAGVSGVALPINAWFCEAYTELDQHGLILKVNEYGLSVSPDRAIEILSAYRLLQSLDSGEEGGV